MFTALDGYAALDTVLINVLQLHCTTALYCTGEFDSQFKIHWYSFARATIECGKVCCYNAEHIQHCGAVRYSALP